jgi:hypothetical protein
MSMTTNWNPAAAHDYFLHGAEEAERYLREVRSKIKSNPSYERVHDEHLAKFYVFNYLHGRTFLDSRESLLRELNTMLRQPVSTTEAYDADRFETYRKSYITELMKKYECSSTSK